MKKIIYLLIALLIGNACKRQETKYELPTSGTIIQVSVIDALLQGIYDGFYPLGDLKKLGNYGIGTFDALNGEMVFFNDTVFQVLSSGEVLIPGLALTTPFAAITEFKADTSFVLNYSSFDILKDSFDAFFPTPNIFYVVKIKGDFNYVKTRSVPGQVKPYPPLVEVTANQPEFEFMNISGDVIGFFCPDYVGGINVKGLHLHFLSSDRKGGGHILEFVVKTGTLEIGYLLDYRLILPPDGNFYGGDFSIDRSHDLEAAEN